MIIHLVIVNFKKIIALIHYNKKIYIVKNFKLIKLDESSYDPSRINSTIHSTQETFVGY